MRKVKYELTLSLVQMGWHRGVHTRSLGRREEVTVVLLGLYCLGKLDPRCGNRKRNKETTKGMMKKTFFQANNIKI